MATEPKQLNKQQQQLNHHLARKKPRHAPRTLQTKLHQQAALPKTLRKPAQLMRSRAQLKPSTQTTKVSRPLPPQPHNRSWTHRKKTKANAGRAACTQSGSQKHERRALPLSVLPPESVVTLYGVGYVLAVFCELLFFWGVLGIDSNVGVVVVATDFGGRTDSGHRAEGTEVRRARRPGRQGREKGRGGNKG